MTLDYSEYLPDPTPWGISAVVEYRWGDQDFKIFSVAGDVREEPWDDGRQIVWLHFKGAQFFGELPKEMQKSAMTMMVPASYVTKITDGPPYLIAKKKKSVDVAVFPPKHPDPSSAMGVANVREAVEALQKKTPPPPSRYEMRLS